MSRYCEICGVSKSAYGDTCSTCGRAHLGGGSDVTRCPGCNTFNVAPGANFCKTCGAWLGRFCPFCGGRFGSGQEVNLLEDRCNSCGRNYLGGGIDAKTCPHCSQVVPWPGSSYCTYCGQSVG